MPENNEAPRIELDDVLKSRGLIEGVISNESRRIFRMMTELIQNDPAPIPCKVFALQYLTQDLIDTFLRGRRS